MTQEKFEYSPELLADIEHVNWGYRRHACRVLNLARRNDPALPIQMGKMFGNFEEGKRDIESQERYERRSKIYIEGNKIYGRVLAELEAWEAKHPQPKSTTAPNKYFDEVGK